MHTVLLRLTGPLQSWGTQSRFSVRDGGAEPSKSGVVGLICAALGRARDESVDDLAALRMGVRVDAEGRPSVDFQTAQGILRADGSSGGSALSRRSFVADADYLVGLEGPRLPLLHAIQAALIAPRWQLFLGRKGYVPGLPVWLPDGVRQDTGLREALKQYVWPVPPRALPRPERWPDRLRLVLEEGDRSQGGDVRRDQPIGAAFATRTFGLRTVDTTFLEKDEITRRQEETDDVPIASRAEPT